MRSADVPHDYLLWLTEQDRDGGSEFGGVPGTPQPYPHDLSASERLHLMYRGGPVDSDLVVPSIHEGQFHE